MSEKQAVDRTVREFAFTVLNRFAGLKMAERRGLVRECISKGLESEGMREVIDCAPGVRAACEDGGFRLLLETIMDELSLGLNVLFDRRSPTGLIWPRPQALDQLLEILNDPELADLWEQDETIGWIYQYFNPKEEREAMRKASSAPRDNRELAVRNQFFTPRYVVEFLTDNTLRRIWYEMRKGDTQLKEACRYLLRRPNEIFLAPGQKPPDGHETQVDLSQEELLRQPVYVLHRPKKDPRDLRILDPACGSGHFLLYAFDLLETIYEEAWADLSSPPSEITNNSLRQDYPDLATLRRAIPGLILRHNLHGIEIDLRCCQIAALALWLRAQRSYQRLGLSPGDRPRIMRSNIVCAEPMPGEKDMLQEFTSRLKPRVLGQLVEVVFEKMQIAGEAGSLLKIEEELRGAIAEAKKQWQAGPMPEQVELFPEGKRPKPEQQRLFDVSGVTDEEFWETAEEKILESLRAYADETSSGGVFRRQLFVEDAAHGFAFIDICRKRYDVVLMNPPFGAAGERLYQFISATYHGAHSDIFAAFIRRGCELQINGRLGAISSRSFLLSPRLEAFRVCDIIPRLEVMSDLGLGVMDEAYVESAAYVLNPDPDDLCLISDFRRTSVKFLNAEEFLKRSFVLDRKDLSLLPQKKLLYSIPLSVKKLFSSGERFEPIAGTAREGMKTFDNERFIRLAWEVRQTDIGRGKKWHWFAKGGSHAFFYLPFHLLVNWEDDGKQLQAVNREVNGSTAQVRQASRYWYKPGITYSKRSAKGFTARVLPADIVFSSNGPAIFPIGSTDNRYLIGWINSKPIRAILHSQSNFGDYSTGAVKRLPWIPSDGGIEVQNLTKATDELLLEFIRIDSHCETSPYFKAPYTDISGKDSSVQSVSNYARVCEMLNELQQSWSEYVSRLYRIPLSSWIDDALDLTDAEASEEGDDNDDDANPSFNSLQYYNDVASWCIGTVLGRWDIRSAICDDGLARIPDPFASLPLCPPGMLQNSQGLPATEAELPPDYPLRISWSGILVDDRNHPEDIESRILEGATVIWKERARAIENEACEILGVPSLREYFRKPNGFFADHLKRYSKSRRQAPIYWPLSTASGSYTLWLYYHRLNEDTLFNAVTEYVTPKVGQIDARIAQLEADLARAEGRAAAKQGKELTDLVEFRDELKEFREELLRVAHLPYKPNLNDGVQITAAPLWRLFRLPKWRGTLEETWKSLERGDYDWAHLALVIWPDRVKEKCRTDHSLAIAHDLESLYQGDPTTPGRKARKRKTKG